MKRFRFFKMTGSGNDFVVLCGNEVDQDAWTQRDTRLVCSRRFGIGADALVFVTPLAAGEVAMKYFNSDGSPAPFCGNAALCVARLAVHLGYCEMDVRIVSKAGTMQCRWLRGSQEAELAFGTVDSAKLVENIPVAADEQALALVTVGVPHLIVLVVDVESIDALSRGRFLRSAPQIGPAGANVQFLGRSRQSDQFEWALRTYERGIENETLACGTGAIACASYLASFEGVESPVRIQMASGCAMSVSFENHGTKLENVMLRGAVGLTFEGYWMASENAPRDDQMKRRPISPEIHLDFLDTR